MHRSFQQLVQLFIYHLLLDLLSFLTLDRPYVQSLTSEVYGNCHVLYSSYEEALSVYLNLKKNNLLKIIRVPGDEMLFGPLSKAIQ